MTIRFVWIIVDRELPGYTLKTEQVPGPYLVSAIWHVEEEDHIRFEMKVSAEKNENAVWNTQKYTRQELIDAGPEFFQVILDAAVFQVCEHLKLKPVGVIIR